MGKRDFSRKGFKGGEMKDIIYSLEECECECDYCGRCETIESKDYIEINAELKKLGWVARKINGQWYDFCLLDCFEKLMKEQS